MYVIKKTSTFKNKVEAQTRGGVAGGGIPELNKIFQCCIRQFKK